MQAIVVRAPGGPEVMRLDEFPEPVAGAGEAVIRVEAAGVNFIDAYFRSGLYDAAYPYVPGYEAAGTVSSVDPGVSEVRIGDRVAFCGVLGTFAEYAKAPASRLVPVPEGLASASAAAALLQGMTAHYLTRSTCALGPGDWCVVHAAAGGTGNLVCQEARGLGARVIAVVSTQAKAELARGAGASAVVLTSEDLPSRVRALTGGAGVRVVYDSVGRDTFMKSLDCPG